jgi:hypothetical protein
MWKSVWSGPETSGWWFGLFVAVIVGLLAVMIAGQQGDQGMRSLILTVMLGLFVSGGTLLGLIVSQHLFETHLSESSATEHLPQGTIQPLTAAKSRPVSRERGFLGLFSADESPRNADSDRRAA